MNVTDEQLKEAQDYLDKNPVDVFWDCYDGFSKEHVSMLLEGKRDDVEMELWDWNVDWIYEEEIAALKYVIDEFELDCEDPSDLIEELSVNIDFDLERIAYNTRGYIALELPVEHDQYWECYGDVLDELHFFGINPADLRGYFDMVEWPDIPDRTPLIPVKGLVEAWVNCFYTGYWQVLMDAGTVLTQIIRGELKDKMVLEKGAELIIHDYWNGASSINTQTIADMPVVVKGNLYHDGANRYGIQSCCGLIDEAWNGVLR